MSEQDPSNENNPLTHEQVTRMLDDTLMKGSMSVLRTFHEPLAQLEEGDIELRNMLRDEETDQYNSPADKLRRAIVYATYQGGTRTPERQFKNKGDQPFSEMIDANLGISDRTRTFINGVINNKTTFIASQPQYLDQESRVMFSHGMRAAQDTAFRKLQDPELTPADKGALALTAVFATIASAEQTSQLGIDQAIDEIAPILAEA